MNDTLRVMFATALLVIGLTTLVSAQQATATDDEVAPLSVIDLQTVALHESGHAFGLHHFGRISVNHGGFKVAGFNILNQVYPGANREVAGTPTGAFCGLYDDWH